jgi:hypothetical protein
MEDLDKFFTFQGIHKLISEEWFNSSYKTEASLKYGICKTGNMVAVVNA